MKLRFKISILLLANLFFISSSANAYDPVAIDKYNQSIDFSKKGLHKEALFALEEAIEIDPKFIDAYFNMGTIYEHLKFYDAALEVFEKIVSFNKKDYESIYKIAMLYYKKNEPAKALAYLFLVPKDVKEFNKCEKLYKDVLSILDKKGTPKKEPNLVEVSNKEKYGKKEKNKIYKGFEGPTGIVQDSKGNTYVANYLNDRIVKIDQNAKRAVFFEGFPINGPISITIDKSDNIYVANYISSDIVKISPNAEPEVILKEVEKPYFVYVNKNKNLLYISEQENNTVIKLNLSSFNYTQSKN